MHGGNIFMGRHTAVVRDASWGNIQYCDTMRLFAQEYIILVEHLQAIREAPWHEHHQELGLPASALRLKKVLWLVL